jgi:hypothetical protein
VITVTVQALCEQAASPLNVALAGEALSANDAAVILGKLNRLFDHWNTTRQAIYRSVVTSYTLTPALQPHTIGPSGATFTVTERPISIDAATLVVSGSRMTIGIGDLAWWHSVSLPTLTSAIPTGLYYDPTYPNGSIYLWPVPTDAAVIELQTRHQFSLVALNDTVTFPQGYYGAIVDTLTEDIAEDFGRTAPERVTARARQERASIFAANDPTHHLVTADSGMPGHSSRQRGTYLTGWQ